MLLGAGIGGHKTCVSVLFTLFLLLFLLGICIYTFAGWSGFTSEQAFFKVLISFDVFAFLIVVDNLCFDYLLVVSFVCTHEEAQLVVAVVFLLRYSVTAPIGFLSVLTYNLGQVNDFYGRILIWCGNIVVVNHYVLFVFYYLRLFLGLLGVLRVVSYQFLIYFLNINFVGLVM